MVIYVKVNDTLYPASVNGNLKDYEWDGRDSKTINLTMTATQAAQIFVNDITWSIIEQFIDDNNEEITEEYDNSDYCLAGDIIDHRNGTISVKMGKITEREMIDILTGGSL